MKTDYKQTYKFCQDTPLHINNDTMLMVQNFWLKRKNKTCGIYTAASQNGLLNMIITHVYEGHEILLKQ